MIRNTVVITILALIASLSVTVLRAIGDDAKAATKKLDGTWVIESILRDPREKAEDEGKGIHCVVAGEKVSLKLPGEDKVAGGLMIKIDTTKKPNVIDLWSDESSFGKPVDEILKEPPVLGIYELDGDSLKVCWVGLENRERPAKFASESGSGCTLVLLRRVADLKK